MDIKGWVDKLNWKRKDVQNETDFVIEHRGRLQRALEATVEPLQITQACLAFRCVYFDDSCNKIMSRFFVSLGFLIKMLKAKNFVQFG